MVEADGSEDVNDFLLRIRELGDRRDKEDEERTRRLEEEILQGRKERQARRAERARSISPTKDSPSNSHTPTSSYAIAQHIDFRKSAPSSSDPLRSSTQPQAQLDEVNRRLSPQDLVENGTPTSKPTTVNTSVSSNSATAISRTGTLSWQQRPSSRGSADTRSRPLSLVATADAKSDSKYQSSAPGAMEDKEQCRSQIAQSLGAKDPTWFKQTADRGLGSAALRKQQTDTISDTVLGGGSMRGGMRLPGLSRESTAEAEPSSPQPESMQSSSPSQENSAPETGASLTQRYANATSTSLGSAFSSPLPTLSAHRLEPPSDSTSQSWSESKNYRTPAMSPSQGRISPERMDRPSSPTKGLGGFVQSAMLKRSDSVNKRWSTQGGPRLSRGNSVASNKSGLDSSKIISNNIAVPVQPHIGGLGREASPLTSSRPGSSHSGAVGRTISETDNPKNEGFVKPDLPEHARKHQGLQADSRPSSTESLDKTIPPSPTRSLESKKWSPAKEPSWLDTALSKADSPKPKVAAAPQQPSWMTEINKAKLARGSVELGKSSSFKEVSVGGFLRSPQTGATLKSPSLNNVPKLAPTVPLKTSNLGITSKLADSPGSSSVTSFTPDNSASPTTGSIKDTHGKSSTSSAEVTTIQPGSPLTVTINNSSRLGSPVPVKPKPITPPKKDFRSNLKPRQVPVQSEQSNEPEFKNVFGKLKRTETRNYVAPDELKSNILRGKAGLAVTDGPKKSERMDELKDSILKKKEEMKVGGGTTTTTRKNSGGSPDQNPDLSVPEAIRKRKALGRSGSSQSIGPSVSNDDLVLPEARFKQVGLSQKPKIQPPEKKTSAPGRLQGETNSSGKLADRFNPALAGILARGPLPMTGGPVRAMTTSPTRTRDKDTVSATHGSKMESSGGQLTHATKARARGPKRRLPAALKTDDTSESPPGARSPVGPTECLVKPSTFTFKLSSTKSEDVAKVPELPLSNITANYNNKPQIVSPPTPDTPSPTLADDDSKWQPVTASKLKEQVTPRSKPAILTKPSPNMAREPAPRKPSASVERPRSVTSPSPSIVKKPSAMTPTLELSEAPERSANTKNTSVLGAAAGWESSKTAESQRPQRARPQIKSPARKDEEAAPKEAGLDKRMVQAPVGLGIQSLSDRSPRTPSRGLPSPPVKSSKSPPLPAKKPDSITNRIASNGALATPSQDTDRPSEPETTEAYRLIKIFFDDVSTSTYKVEIDTQAVLAARHSPEQEGKIKTLRKQIWEITGDGKKIPVPSQQEHILFEESMYLCTHAFGSPSGKRTTEVYLWCGDGVSQSAAEDAQLFSRNAAKEAGGKLIILAQGKETSNFFEALGGIVITRRGSSSRFGDSTGAAATYMLRGRRHIGQIAFDEVAFAPYNLCSGFPYIVSATSGRLYLWKGKGSGADELGCARLIGMDLGLTGEIEEIDEGKEPDTFWKAFPGSPAKQQAPEAGYWHLKANCDKYTTRLFSVELENRPKSGASSYLWGRRGSAPTVEEPTQATIKEVTPYAQKDLGSNGVYVLDAFFEVWVIVGSQATSKFSAFCTALNFAQEYGILAASIEDRPFVPVGNVVLSGTPNGIKTSFRKWEDNGGNKAGHKGEGEVVVPLNEAVEAMHG